MAGVVVGAVRVDLVANTARFSKGIGKAKTNLRGLGTASKKTGVTMRGLGIATASFLSIAAGFAALRAATRMINGFNEALQQSVAIMADLSGEMRGNMVKAAQEVAMATKFSGKEASAAFYYLASAGLDAERSIAALPAVAKFAQAGMFDLSRATDLLTDAQSALGMDSNNAVQHLQNMTTISDQLVRANQLSNASVELFADALTNKAAKSGAFLGMTLSETIAVLAVFAKQGRKGAEAGTAFAIVMRELSVKAQENAKAFEAQGVAVYEGGKFRKIVDIFHDLDKALMGVSTQEKIAKLAMMGFTQKSIENLKLVIGMSGATKDFEKALRSAGGATEKVASKQWTEFSRAMNTMKAAVEKLVVTIGTPLMNGIGKMVNGFANADPTIRRVVAGIAGFTAGLLLATVVIPKVILLIKWMTRAYKAMTKAHAISLAFAGPKGWAILLAGAVAAAGAIWAVDTAFEDLDKSMNDTVAAANGVAVPVVDAMNSVSKAVEGATEQFKGAETAIKNLKKEIATFGAPDAMKELYELKLGGATDAQLREVRRLQQILAGMEKQRDQKTGMAGVDTSNPALKRGTQAAYSAQRQQVSWYQKMIEEQRKSREVEEETNRILARILTATEEEPAPGDVGGEDLIIHL